MAERKIEIKKLSNSVVRDKINKTRNWLEDKSKRVRQLWEPRAARSTRPSRHHQTSKMFRTYISYSTPMGLALVVLFLGLSLSLPKNQIQQAKERLAKNPADFEAHLMMAEEYLDHHQLPEAEKELLLAEESQPVRKFGDLIINQSKNNVLGEATSTLTELWQIKRESDPKDIKYLIDQWGKIIAQRPDYRDGYLQLALLNYKIYEDEKAKQYLGEALDLDPNFEPAKALGKNIQ